MELSTELLANVTFREQRRGYSQDQVDEFLERVGVAVAELQERLRTAEQRASEAEATHDQDEIMRTLVLAQRTARAAVDEANVDAARIRAEAEATATARTQEAEAAAGNRIQEAEEAAEARRADAEATALARLEEAEATASSLLSDAEAESGRRLADAESTASARLSEAESAAAVILAAAELAGAERRAAAEARLAELDAEISRREREELAELETRRDGLQAEVEAMVQFLDQGRDRLRAELQSQLARLDDAAAAVPTWVRAVRADPGAPPPAPTDREVPDADDRADLTDADMTAAVEDAPEGRSEADGAGTPLLNPPRQTLFDRAVEDPTGGLPSIPDLEDEAPLVMSRAELELEPEAEPEAEADPVLARARADLADALREAGVLLDTAGSGAVPAVGAAADAPPGDAAPSDEAAAVVAPAVAAEANGDRLGDVTGPVQQLEWRSVSIPDEPDDDPFLAELRRAVTDTEPLGPRDEEPSHEHHSYEDPEPRFRLRRNRG